MAEQKKQQNSKGQAAPPPVNYSISLIAEEPKQKDDNFVLVVEARVFRNDVPVKDEKLVLKKGVNVIAQRMTDESGTCVFIFTVPLSDEGQLMPLRVQLNSHKVEGMITVSLPKHLKQAEDPDRLRLRYYTVNDSGQVFLSLRIMQERGFAVKNSSVLVNYKGLPYTVKLDDDSGCASILLPDALEPGQAEEVIASISGIVGECVIHVYRPRVKLKGKDIFFIFIRRISFLVLLLGTFLSFVFSIVSLIMIFSKSFKERLESNDNAGDIFWVILLTLCFVPPFFLVINMLWFWFRLNMCRAFEYIKEKIVYRRKAMARDSHWEKMAELLEKSLDAKKDENIKSQTQQRSDNYSQAKDGWITNLKLLILTVLSDFGFDWVRKVAKRDRSK